MQKISVLNRSRILALLLVLLVPFAVLADPINYTVTSRVESGLGTVTLGSTAGSTQIVVGGSGNYMTPVSSGVTSVTVNGYTAYYPVTTDIVLPNSNPGRIIFTSTTSVVVLDLLEGA
jgi:hypothetical protein